MRISSEAVAVVIASAALVLSGCSGDTEPGVARPTSAAPGSTTGDAPVTTTAAPAARPAELPLTGVPPCELVTPEARTRFGLTGSMTPQQEFPGVTMCIAVTSTGGQYVVFVTEDEGMDGLGDPGTPMTVGGFPAAMIEGGPLPDMCHVSVDVAEGQRLDVEVQPFGDGRTQDQNCQDTTAFAETVLAQLRQRLGR